MNRTTLTLATLVAIVALAGCHSGTPGSTAAPAADTSITSAPSTSDVHAAIGPQVADDVCWSQTDNAHPTWPAPVVPAQFHAESRSVLTALAAEGLVDDEGTSVTPTDAGKKDTTWWDSKRGACMGTSTVATVSAVRLNHGNPHAPDGSVDVTYVRTLTDVPAWAAKHFKSTVDLTGPVEKHVTLLKDSAAPGGWRIAGLLVQDASQPTGWREDKVN